MPSAEAPAAKPHPRGLQFSRGALLAAISVLALVCAALNNPTGFWAGAIGVTLVLMLLTAGLAVIYRTGSARVFAVGFLLFGCVYGSLGFLAKHNLVPLQDPTDAAAQWAFERWHVPTWETMQTGGRGRSNNEMGSAFRYSLRFKETFHSSVAILMSFVGGLLAHAVKATERRKSESGSR